MTKTCEACGVTFSCGGYQCWCGNVGVTESQMDWIAARFQDCLCPACLQKVSEGKTDLVPFVKSVHPNSTGNG